MDFSPRGAGDLRPAITFLCVRASTSDKKTVPLSETGEVLTELNIDDTEMAYVDPSNDRNQASDPFHMMPVYNALMKHLKLPKGEHLVLQTERTSAELWVAGIGGNKDVRRRAAKLALCGTELLAPRPFRNGTSCGAHYGSSGGQGDAGVPRHGGGHHAGSFMKALRR